jgi:hypothetical protein
MAGVTPNLGLQLLDPSQAQPEVPINFDLNLLDGLLSPLNVEASGSSPGVIKVRTLRFLGATVTAETDDAALVTIDYPTDSPESGGGGDVDSPSSPGTPVTLQLACSDLVTALIVAASVGYVRAPHAFTLTAVRASVLVASSSGLPTVNIKKNGVTVLSTNLSINSGAYTSVGATTPAVISVPAIADDDLLTIDVTVAGTGTKGLIVSLIGHV